MQIKLARYVAEFLVRNGISDCFMVTGGGAMHLDDALGHQDGLHCVFNHHEQACSIAAEGYTRMTGKLAAVCVTSGPGGTNAITGVMGGWLDSIPMFILSGQVKRETTIWSCPDLGLRLRHAFLFRGRNDGAHSVLDFDAVILEQVVRQPQPGRVHFRIVRVDLLVQARRVDRSRMTQNIVPVHVRQDVGIHVALVGHPARITGVSDDVPCRQFDPLINVDLGLNQRNGKNHKKRENGMLHIKLLKKGTIPTFPV